MREKLIEFLHDVRMNAFWHRWGCEEVADYMIANGVTIPVRCKDCKHWVVDDDVGYCDNPDGLDNYARPDDFCSYGGRTE